MGCSAAEYEEFAHRFETAEDVAEQMLVGSTWEILTRKNPRPEGDDKVVKLKFGESYVPVMTRLKLAFGVDEDEEKNIPQLQES